MQLDALPSDTGGAVRELDSYDWRSAEAREAYQEIRDLLGRELLDQRFAGMKQAMQNVTPGDVERIREMLDDLNSLLANHAQGQDTEQQFAEFMRPPRRVLPGEPAEHRRAGRPAGPAGRGRPADAQLDDGASSAPS